MPLSKVVHNVLLLQNIQMWLSPTAFKFGVQNKIACCKTDSNLNVFYTQKKEKKVVKQIYYKQLLWKVK